jgi:carboxymethylenebutenolidase
MRSSLCLLALLPLAGLACSGKAPVTEEPVPTMQTETITYSSGEEKVKGYLCVTAGKKPAPALLLIHDDFGLTDWTREQARRFGELGYNVLAVDLYRGETAGNIEDAHILERGLPEDRVFRDLKAAVDYLAARKDVRPEALGVVGWDMGGGYALDAAIRDARLRAVVTCYGRLTTDAKLLAPLNASVLGVFAGKDKGITPETIEQFRVAMIKAGKSLAGLRVYGQCGHGFLNPAYWPDYGTPPPNDVQSAWGVIDDQLERVLRQ